MSIKREIFLENLPKSKNGKVIWKESIGYKVHFIYDDVVDEIEIVDYKSGELTIKYKDKIIDISSSNFIGCRIGKLLGRVTKDFRIEIGTTFKDEKRDLTIIDREYRVKIKNNGGKLNEKWYKYHCNRDGNEDWIIEYDLLKGKGCNVCCSSPRKLMLGVNTIWDKARWMCDLGVSEEDAKKYMPNSTKPINVKCIHCGKIKSISPHAIFRNNSIGCNCGDSVSYPEKFMFNMLTQLGIDFIWQLTKINFKWCGKYKYDFYFAINEEEYIIETHGEQHYEKSRNYMSLEKNIKNDRIKYELAIKNGIKPENYIAIDFRYSNLKWGRENIINSRLNQIFDLTNINWEECNMYAIKSNKIKESCDVWNNRKYNESVSTIAKQIGMDRNVLRKYLKRGSELGLCDYDPREERRKTNEKVYNLNNV